ncbi:MAG: RimK/LysX family protein [Legionellaceae bacterium]|nr:RimK/LysX family protein [Legionellaceae bacterium]
MRVCALFFLVCLSFAGSAMIVDGKTIYGYVEKVTLHDPDLTVSAKLDTGAKSASLSAIRITETIIDDKTYLSFIVPTKKGDIPFTCEYAGRVKIKARVGETKIHSMLKTSIRRPVVIMKMSLDGKEKSIRVNLTNRKRFSYPLLLGRESIIAFDGIVDPHLKYTLKKKQIIKVMDKS